MPAYVGVYTARLEMPWVRSLKEKRALVRPVIERIKARFPVSAARLEGQNDHKWEAVGFVVIGAEAEWVEATLQAVADFLERHGEFRVRAVGFEVVRWDLEDPGLPQAL